MPHFTVTATFGRNIGTEPMSDEDWDNFTEDVKSAIESSMGYREHFLSDTKTGVGEWDMSKEESRSVKYIYVHAPSVFQASAIRRRVSAIRFAYKQDAIAIEFGESELI